MQMKVDTLFSHRRTYRYPDRYVTVDSSHGRTGSGTHNLKPRAGCCGNHLRYHYYYHTVATHRNLPCTAKEGVASMFSGVIRCNHCGNEAVAEILGIVTMGPVASSQRYFGYNHATGYLSFRCPACGTELAINPAEVLISRFLQGLPALSGILAPQTRNIA